MMVDVETSNVNVQQNVEVSALMLGVGVTFQTLKIALCSLSTGETARGYHALCARDFACHYRISCSQRQDPCPQSRPAPVVTTGATIAPAPSAFVRQAISRKPTSPEKSAACIGALRKVSPSHQPGKAIPADPLAAAASFSALLLAARPTIFIRSGISRDFQRFRRSAGRA
jgi:hypothetical protein